MVEKITLHKNTILFFKNKGKANESIVFVYLQT